MNNAITEAVRADSDPFGTLSIKYEYKVEGEPVTRECSFEGNAQDMVLFISMLPAKHRRMLDAVRAHQQQAADAQGGR